MITRTQFKDHIRALKEQMRLKKQEILDIKKQIDALQMCIGVKNGKKNRKGIHLEIKKLIEQKGPQTATELTNELVNSNKLTNAKQPRITVYNALKRKSQDFFQDADKKWHLKTADTRDKTPKNQNIDDIFEDVFGNDDED